MMPRGDSRVPTWSMKRCCLTLGEPMRSGEPSGEGPPHSLPCWTMQWLQMRYTMLYTGNTVLYHVMLD